MSSGAPYPTQQVPYGVLHEQPGFVQVQPGAFVPMPMPNYAPVTRPPNPGAPPGVAPYPVPHTAAVQHGAPSYAGPPPAQASAPVPQQPYVGFAPQEPFPMAPPPYDVPGFGKTSPGSSTPVDTMDRDTAPAIESWDGFSNKEIRRAFVRKVYAILMIQLSITFGFVALFIYEPHVKFFVQNNLAAYISAFAAFFVIYIALVCCEGVRRSYPTNIILLFIFTLVMSYMVGVISSFHETDVVLMAAGICAACCLAVSVFSIHTKFDFTSCGGFLFIAAWALLLFGIMAIFTYNRILNTVYAVLGAILFMAFLAFDTQLLMGGRKHELSPEEHIFAALQLYMDVVQIFLFLLRILGRR